MIEINNLTVFKVDNRLLKNIARTVLNGEKTKGKIDLSIALLELKRIREINKRYRGKNRATDVLAFPPFAKGYGGQARFLQKDSGLGEIIICPSEVKRNAKRFKLTFKKELSRALIHGILHLLGYDHEKSKKEAKKMEKKQRHYFCKA